MRTVIFASMLALVACSSQSIKSPTHLLPNNNDGIPTISSAGFPAYKTTIVSAPFEMVKKSILKTASLEGFERIETLDKNTIIVGGRANVEHNRTEEIQQGALAVVILAPLVVLSLAMGASPSFDSSGESKPNYLSAVFGMAKLRDLGDSTEVKLNFNRVLYHLERKPGGVFETSEEMLTLALTGGDRDSLFEYKIELIEQVHEPEIYTYAFRRLQGMPAELPERKKLIE